MRFVALASLGLLRINFTHLFMVSLLPFATAWVARTRLASSAARRRSLIVLAGFAIAMLVRSSPRGSASA
jgi:uncharacterized membrane protein